MNENLEGKYITIYTDGGWKAEGTVQLDKKDRLGIIANDDSIFIILKAKIAMIRTDDQRKPEEKQEEKSPSYHHPVGKVSRRPSEEAEGYAPTESNTLGEGNQYGSLIPEDLLEGATEGKPTDDFAINFFSNTEGKLEVTVDPKE